MSRGDRAARRAALAAALLALPAPPRDRGRLLGIVIRPEHLERRALERARLLRGPGGGVEGDRQPRRYADSPGRYRDSAITAIRSDVAALLCGDLDPIWTGDNLRLALDLSERNLPVGSRIRIGEVELEVTPRRHTGCGKFAARFGAAALSVNAEPRLRGQRIRGVFFQALGEGEIAVGDPIEVLYRAPPTRRRLP